MTWVEQLTPWLPLLVVLVGGIVTGAFGVYNRRRGNEEQKTPTVAEIWAEQRKQERELSLLHAAYAVLRGMFSAYVFRVRDGGDIVPTEREKRYLTMSSAEAMTPTEPKE